MKFEFIADQAGLKEFPIDYMCRMLGVTRQAATSGRTVVRPSMSVTIQR